MMRKSLVFLITIAVITLSYQSRLAEPEPERQWSSYRGYYSNGVLDNANLPESWNVETNENVLWKYKVPGLGLSSPVIWGEKLFITSAVSESDDEGFKTGMYGSIGSVDDESVHEWVIYCLDKNTGSVLWEKMAYKGVPEQKRHPKSSHANSTMATDGNYVVAFFGSEGLYCYDMDGNLQWQKDFGVLLLVFFVAEDAEWEFATSPIIHDGSVIIQCDVMENSFVASYDVASGKDILGVQNEMNIQDGVHPIFIMTKTNAGWY